jgi:outer membrane protein OmpA-like peptidoglycan-associated protein
MPQRGLDHLHSRGAVLMKTTIGLIGLIMILAAAVMAGCAAQPKLTQDQIMGQYPQVQSLDSALKQARSNGAELLAPQSYAAASSSLASAMSAAESNDEKDAAKAANEGLGLISKLSLDTERSRDILSDVLQARDRAYAAGAANLQKEAIADLDNDLKKTATLVEKGDVEKAKELRPELLGGYQQLELATLKQGTVELAKSAIASAKEQGAKKLAPITLARAEEQMGLAMTVLDADRSQTAKAEVYAKRARWYAQQSASITETVKDFERRDYSMEDVVLWHQQQLGIVNEPLGIDLPFNESSDKAALSLKVAVSELVNESAQLKVASEKVGKQIEMTEKERQIALQRERDDKQKFDRVQAMFTANEANVFRKGQNVLISAQGFVFPSGQSEIQTVNFPLMNKIIRAIKIFPGASVEVTGHTDSTGDDNINQVLSNTRAEKVAKFLVEVGEMVPDKITSRGFGESRPVATNETAEGRAENRRVEINIINL